MYIGKTNQINNKTSKIVKKMHNLKNRKRKKSISPKNSFEVIKKNINRKVNINSTHILDKVTNNLNQKKNRNTIFLSNKNKKKFTNKNINKLKNNLCLLS